MFRNNESDQFREFMDKVGAGALVKNALDQDFLLVKSDSDDSLLSVLDIETSAICSTLPVKDQSWISESEFTTLFSFTDTVSTESKWFDRKRIYVSISEPNPGLVSEDRLGEGVFVRTDTNQEFLIVKPDVNASSLALLNLFTATVHGSITVEDTSWITLNDFNALFSSINDIGNTYRWFGKPRVKFSLIPF